MAKRKEKVRTIISETIEISSVYISTEESRYKFRFGIYGNRHYQIIFSPGGVAMAFHAYLTVIGCDVIKPRPRDRNTDPLTANDRRK